MGRGHHVIDCEKGKREKKKREEPFLPVTQAPSHSLCAGKKKKKRGVVYFKGNEREGREFVRVTPWNGDKPTEREWGVEELITTNLLSLFNRIEPRGRDIYHSLIKAGKRKRGRVSLSRYRSPSGGERRWKTLRGIYVHAKAPTMKGGEGISTQTEDHFWKRLRGEGRSLT